MLKILEEERKQLVKKLNAVEQAILIYKNAYTLNGLAITGEAFEGLRIAAINPDENFFQKYYLYNASIPTKDKALLIIRTENRFLHVREIARIMQILEGEEMLQHLIKKISPALSNLKKLPSSPLVSIEAGSHFNTFWGYREWVEGDGNIRKPFMYNETEITKNKKQALPA